MFFCLPIKLNHFSLIILLVLYLISFISYPSPPERCSMVGGLSVSIAAMRSLSPEPFMNVGIFKNYCYGDLFLGYQDGVQTREGRGEIALLILIFTFLFQLLFPYTLNDEESWWDTVPPPINGSISTVTITLIAPKVIVQWSPPHLLSSSFW